ncbi:MAG: indolepyruvate oxidoreductase subunit beta [Methanobrevibacter sp.]|jgi:indolepyruvate ferredoxin oxidoreductase beta subunit|nr:indolepyruvate oxidoreductase subunit beta [Candidatus Methanovirga aequatorialis]
MKDVFSKNPEFYKDSYTIYVCGVGGQGIIKTSAIIGNGAMNEGKNVVMSEIHGMSQRGGVVSTELKIGNYKSSLIEEFGSDMIIGFEPIEVVRSLNKANKDTKILININPIIPPNIGSQKNSYPNIDETIAILKDNYNHVHTIDGNQIAKKVGSLLTLNMVLLGAATADETFPISKDNIISSMKDNLKPKAHEMNIRAIEKGYENVKSLTNF